MHNNAQKHQNLRYLTGHTCTAVERSFRDNVQTELAILFGGVTAAAQQHQGTDSEQHSALNSVCALACNEGLHAPAWFTPNIVSLTAPAARAFHAAGAY
jgi:hypothetical protein